MLHKKTQFMICSVSQSNESVETNVYNTATFKQWLDYSNISYKLVDGVYNGDSEDSFLIALPNDFAARENLLILICGWLVTYNQECYLYSDSHGYCSLHNVGGVMIERLGQYQVTSKKPVESMAYTYLGNNQYMIAGV